MVPHRDSNCKDNLGHQQDQQMPSEKNIFTHTNNWQDKKNYQVL